jgi:signal peptidase I
LFEKSRAAGFPPGPNGLGTGGFEIIRKGEEQLLADRRIVWDNDQQPKELAEMKVPARWNAITEGKENWRGDDSSQPKDFAHSGDALNWIRYHHLAEKWKTSPPDLADPTDPTDPSLLAKQLPRTIDNFLGYNAGRELDPFNNQATSRDNSRLDQNWVGDLILECEATLDNGSEVVLELSKSINRFQAVFAGGNVTLNQLGRGGENFKKPSRPCKFVAGKHRLRLANVDCRLWVWVDGKCIDFGTDGDYQPVLPEPGDDADADGVVKANDVEAPASIGAKGNVTIRHITLHRDIYYTRRGSDSSIADIFYVQPGHYLCLGDNSAQSSDSRVWGVVPERLMLGKAVFVFWPCLPTMRVGFIK